MCIEEGTTYIVMYFFGDKQYISSMGIINRKHKIWNTWLKKMEKTTILKKKEKFLRHGIKIRLRFWDISLLESHNIFRGMDLSSERLYYSQPHTQRRNTIVSI